ncbi:MAG: sulfatase-like hydrolase/transferase, partial [Flavobacteriaceae bacterium]
MRTKRIFSVFVMLVGLQLAAQEDTPKNVLFIIVDDLRTALPTYGNSQVVAPNITALSRRAVQFNNSFVNIPTCGASRASILTGIRPTRDYYKNYMTRIDEDYPDAITLSELLQSNGYTTISNGKVSHHRDDKEETWDEVWRPNSVSTKDYLLPENIAANKLPHENNHPPVEKAAVSDDMYKDGKIANKTI